MCVGGWSFLGLHALQGAALAIDGEEAGLGLVAVFAAFDAVGEVGVSFEPFIHEGAGLGVVVRRAAAGAGDGDEGRSLVRGVQLVEAAGVGVEACAEPVGHAGLVV